ncbi:MAG: cytochrome c biogenesis protein [bacterium]
MIWRIGIYLWVAVTMTVALTQAPLVPVLAETTRVLYFHVPAAWITVVALAWSMIQSALYLWKRDLRHDDHAAAAAELGLLFCIVASVSGALWAKARWGAYWNWDPRQTSIFFLFLIYAAYLALRGSIEGDEKRARLSAVYSLVAFVSVPPLMFVVPRIYSTLHPDPIINTQGKVDMDPMITLCFMLMLVGFTFLYAWLQALRVRVTRLERRAADA